MRVRVVSSLLRALAVPVLSPAAFAQALVVAWAPAVEAQNRPPIARASVTPGEVLVGEPATFTGSTSIDPDMGPDALSYSWDFGDGGTSANADTTHTYAAAGAFDVALTVRDGLAQSLATLTVHVLDAPAPSPPAATTAIALDPTRDRLWAVNPDSRSVTVVDAATLGVLGEIAVGDRPTTVALSADAALAFVACRDEGTIRVVDADRLERIETIAIGHRPWGVVVAPASGELFVSVEGEDRVVRLAPDGRATLGSLDVADGPRGIAVAHDGRRAFVSHFISRSATGTVTALDLEAFAVAREIALAEDPGPDRATLGRGVPNLLSAIAIDPAGLLVWAGGLKSNSSRGAYLDGQPFPFTNRVRGLAAPIAIAAGTDVVDRRIDTNDADRVSAIAFSPRGRYGYFAHPGAGRVSVYDLSRARLHGRDDADAVPHESRVDVGHAPNGLALSRDAMTLFVLDELSRAVSVVDVSVPTAAVVVATIPLTREPLDANVALGKRLFNRSRGPTHSQDDYIACASCHPEGGVDGRTWDFTQYGEGLRNTIDLRGRAGTGHGPVHWSANFDEIQDFENDIVFGFGGTGLAADGLPPHPPLAGPPNAGRSAELDALAAYVTSLGAGAPSPHRGADGSLSEAAWRGRAIFVDPATRCAECHVPPRYTDSVLAADPSAFVLHDVGTLGPGSGTRLGGALTGLDTPSLIGGWDGAPYLHDGRAATLREVLVDHDAGDRHGTTSHLTPAQIDDLVAYLLAIDGRSDVPPPGAGADAGLLDGGAGPESSGSGCGCTVAPAPRAPFVLVLVLVLVPLWHLRRIARPSSRERAEGASP